MERLCFGTFAKRLQKTLINYNNEAVVVLLLDLILSNVDIKNRNGNPYDVSSKIVSELITHKKDVHRSIKKAASTITVIQAAKDFFEDAVLPYIPQDLIESTLINIKKLILADTTIPPETSENFISLCHTSTLAEFLSSVYLYAIKQNNKIDTGSLPKAEPTAQVQNHSIPESDFYLLLETACTCPLCGKTLVHTKGEHSFSGYAITEIIPSQASPSHCLALGDFIEEAPKALRSNNLIALCLDCSNKYKAHTTEEECLKLKDIKEKLLRNHNAMITLDEIPLEDRIEEVLRKITLYSIDNTNEILDYTALRVRDKMNHSNMILILKIENYVLHYYRFIQSVFAQMEREGSIDFDILAGDVKKSYKKLANNGYSQQEIFDHLVDWFMKKTNTRDRLPCEVILAFFVQNCEVFHALT